MVSLPSSSFPVDVKSRNHLRPLAVVIEIPANAKKNAKERVLLSTTP